MRKFLRRNSLKHSRLGKGRRKLQKWRNATGRHSKIRRNRFGYTKSPRIGFKSPRSESGKINGKIPLMIRNMLDVSKANEKNILIIARTLGAKKRIEIIKKIDERGLQILNVKKTGGNNGLK
ncbi:MAG: eL32 family ribosomal protein [Nanoarchaeota archaeon]